MSATQTVFYRDRHGLADVAARARVGELSRDAIRVCGFASPADAVTAASVAFHALREYLAKRFSRSLRRPGLAGVAGDAAAVTVRAVPNADAARFCFELEFPRRVAAVDEDSMLSFPASDPPGWISMWLGKPTNVERSKGAV